MTVEVPARPRTASSVRGLISPELHATLVRRTARDHDMPTELAERSLDQTLIMLHAIVEHPGLTIHPPRVIDVSWHEFILHTAAYTEFCDRFAGHYLHHTPDDGATDGGANVRASAARLRDLGYEIDDELWAMQVATGCANYCSGCDNSVPPPG